MSGADRFVVLGLAPPRAAWFSSVGLWATTGALPVEFVKCLSAEEVRVRLTSGRPFSALLADVDLPSVDRDLAATAEAAGCALLLVIDGRRRAPELPGASVLAAGFGRDELLAVLQAAATRIPSAAADTVHLPGGTAPCATPPAGTVPGEQPTGTAPGAPSADVAEVNGPGAGSPASPPGTLVAVTGSGGTGVSTAAISLSQALAGRAGRPGSAGSRVLLADLRLRAEQAMLHDVDPAAGLQELVEAHRRGRPSPEAVRAVTVPVSRAGYHLLAGLRRSHMWPVLRPAAFAATLVSLTTAYDAVVCDIDSDIEGEAGGGSRDIEDRNVMARTTAVAADVVLAVGLPSVKGLHALVRVIGDLVHLGVAPERVVTVLNRSPRHPRERARLAAAVAELAGAATGHPPGALVYLPERPIEADLRNCAPLPPALGAPLAGALAAILTRRTARIDSRPARSSEPELVRPGSLGVWADA